MKPTFTRAGVSADIGGMVIRDDIVSQHFLTGILDLMGIARVANEMVSCAEGLRFALVMVQQAGAGKDDVELGLGGVRMHGKVSFTGRKLGEFHIEGMSATPLANVLRAPQSQGDMLPMQCKTSLWRNAMFDGDVREIEFVHHVKLPEFATHSSVLSQARFVCKGHGGTLPLSV